MFYKNKETKEVIYVVYSNAKVVISFAYNEEGVTKGGKIHRYSKSRLKKDFLKFKKCQFKEPDEETRNLIIDEYENNTYMWNNDVYTEDYLIQQEIKDRKEMIEKQTEAGRKRLLKTLADDYNPNGIKVKD